MPKTSSLVLLALTLCGVTVLPACGSDSSSGSSNGSTDGGGDGRPAFVPTGSAITAPDDVWTWIDLPDTFCRDGSTTGLGVYLNSASKNVMIYLEGGGACFDSITCLANPANDDVMRGAATGGVFDRANAENPVRDWNAVYIPYCTGDIFAGTNENGSIAGVAGTQKFVGRKNMEAYLNRIVPTFPKPDHVLLTGVSAGGFGAASNADLFAWAFGDGIPFTLIDDSGPSMSGEFLPACLQGKWRTTWGFDGSLLKDCGSACPNKDEFAVDYTKFLAGKYPERASGLIESNADAIITGFFGYGLNDCTGGFTTPVPAATFDAGLQDLRTQMAPFPKFLTYFPASTQHTWIRSPSFYTATEGGTKLLDWFTAVLNDEPAGHVGN